MTKNTDLVKQNTLPKHVGIIMDGNGRWAKKQGKDRIFGHQCGTQSLRKAIEFAREKSINILTVFAFSTENWKRPKKEVSVLMNLFLIVLKTEIKKMHKQNIKLKVVGDLSNFNAKMQKKIAESEKLTQGNTGLLLNVAANYGGRWDITEATKLLLQKALNNEINVQDINENIMDGVIQQTGLVDVDLMIRTGGETRLSNFLLWQLAYAELYFTDVLWPDFDKVLFQKALDSFAGRTRNFGKTSE